METRSIKDVLTKSIQIEVARVLVMGSSFKENRLDLPYTSMVDMIVQQRPVSI